MLIKNYFIYSKYNKIIFKKRNIILNFTHLFNMNLQIYLFYNIFYFNKIVVIDISNKIKIFKNKKINFNINNNTTIRILYSNNSNIRIIIKISNNNNNNYNNKINFKI